MTSIIFGEHKNAFFTYDMKQSGVKNYISGAFSELRKVVWPSKTELLKLTIAVVVIGGFFTVMVGVLDFLFNFGYQYLLEI